ncbi:reverse transcriptase domain-containing protein [Tanacetum coccineum]
MINQTDLENCNSMKGERVKSEHLYSAGANEINEKKPELKDLPSHLEYAYIHGNEAFPVIVSSNLSEKEKKSLLQALEKHKGAIAWKMSYIKRISPSFCTHKILMEDDFKPVIQPQRRLYPKVQDVVKNEIVKLLDLGLIYLISDSSWVSPIHVVLKKGGITVVLNDNNELIPSRIVTRWRVCIDYRFFQILTTSEDQEKTTFTCPYGTFAYKKDAIWMLARCIEVDKAKTDVIAKLPYPTKVKGIRSFLGNAGFNIEIKDKKGAENLAAYHLSRLENPHMGVLTEREIADEFPDEHLMMLKDKVNNVEPWLCPDNIIRRCVARNEIFEILIHCQSGPTGGHHSASITRRKVYKSGFFWPSIFKDAKDYVMRCDACQRLGNISSRSEMPQNNIHVCEIFDIWGLYFMGPFSDSNSNKYILVDVDYVSKWVEAQALPINDARW